MTNKTLHSTMGNLVGGFITNLIGVNLLSSEENFINFYLPTKDIQAMSQGAYNFINKKAKEYYATPYWAISKESSAKRALWDYNHLTETEKFLLEI